MRNDARAALGAKRGRRPRVAGAVASARIWAWLTPSERADLERVATENHTTVAALIREAVNEYVSDYGERVVFSATGNSPTRPS